MRFLSLFAGIGGFDLGLERAGMECGGQVEIDPYCLAVLKKHWPNVKRMEDIRNVQGNEFGTIDLISGGFPCQPFSQAGKRRGTQDDRYLWPEMLRAIKAIRPAWVFGENVIGIIHLALDTVLSDLENEGYETRAFTIPACALDAPHRRERVWIVAHSKGRGFPVMRGAQRQAGQPDSIYKDVADSTGKGSTYDSEMQKREKFPGRKSACGGCLQIPAHSKSEGWQLEPDVGRVAYGIPSRVDRLKCLGNAVVPQIVEEIGKAIIETENKINANRF